MEQQRISIHESDIATIHVTDGIGVKELRKDPSGTKYLEYYSYNDIDENSTEMYCDICGTRYEPKAGDTLCPNECFEADRVSYHYTEIANIIYNFIDDGLLVTITLKNKDAYDFQLQDVE